MLNDPVMRTETIRVMEQSVFTGRQVTFEILQLQNWHEHSGKQILSHNKND